MDVCLKFSVRKLETAFPTSSQLVSLLRRRLRGLIHHVQDEHEWIEELRCDKHDLTECIDEECISKHEWLQEKRCDKHGQISRHCNFHPLTVCNCRECEDNRDHKCVGEHYHTREILTCPFHLLAYLIECHERIKMANQLVHYKLHRDHSNWLEVSLQDKHLSLERLY